MGMLSTSQRGGDYLARYEAQQGRGEQLLTNVRHIRPTQAVRYNVVMSASELARRKQNLIVEIQIAFFPVHRGGGVSWSEADVIDSYGTAEARRAARAADKDTHWCELLDDKQWRPDRQDRFNFLDAIGAAYYLPATMIRELQTERDCWLVDKLAHGPLSRTWSRLNAAQSRCVAQFLRLRIEYTIAEGEDISARTYQAAMDQGWDRFADQQAGA